MKVIFLGTPEVAAAGLRAVLDSPHEIVAVVTQPDRPRGRGRHVAASPMKALAEVRGIPLLQPETPKAATFPGELRAFAPDVLAVIAYGHILPIPVLEVARAVNVHFSLLPRYRGAAPVQRALMDGATETGVSVFLLEPTVDTGPVLARERVAVADDETSGELLARLAPIGAGLLVRTLDALESGTVHPEAQTDEEATKAPKIRPEEAEIDWEQPSRRIANLVRALNPNPGAWTRFRGRRLNVWRARPATGDGKPGTVVDPAGLVVAAGEGAVALDEVQPEGKRAMAGAEFARGHRPGPDDVLG